METVSTTERLFQNGNRRCLVATASTTGSGSTMRGLPSSEKVPHFEELLRENLICCEALGYPVQVYDLGNLGFGHPLVVEGVDTSLLVASGSYGLRRCRMPSRALHKPAVINSAIALARAYELETVCYVDSDCCIIATFDELLERDDWDLALTVRTQAAALRTFGQCNTGVMFWRTHEGVESIWQDWNRQVSSKKAAQDRNDQFVFNRICGTLEKRPEAWSVKKLGDVRILFVPCDIYNNFYLKRELPAKAKIVHFKTDVRERFYQLRGQLHERVSRWRGL